jgi:acetylornithine deacetylase/succinyl-diaminopimelate desuccinylase-like protein
MATSIESQGVTLAISYGASPTSFVTIANVVDFSGPGGQASVIDITNLSSTFREKRMGIPDEGQVTFNVNLDPDANSHTLIRNVRAARVACEFRLTLTDASPTTLTFDGYVLGFVISGAVDDVVKAAITIEIDGPADWA